MNKTSVILAGVLAASFALPAMAGPNWTVIREAQKFHKIADQQPASQQIDALPEVLPRDHGLRAKSTPWLNKERAQYLMAQERKKNAAHLAYHKADQSSNHG